MAELTIGMATYNDFDGVYFTIQALRLYQDLQDTELLVIDNFGCDHTQEFIEGWSNARYPRLTEKVGTASPRNLVFEEASGEAVLCCDSHVLFAPGAIARLKHYHQAHPDCLDLLHGPLVYDDLQNVATHFDPVWRAQMWGTWGLDPRGVDPEAEPFEIPMQGLGAFSCRRSAWLGFNPAFRGFGGEEGYIHEKFRQAGGHSLCLPWLRWTHRFGRPAGVPYPISSEDRLRNYLIGHLELGLDPAPALEHFAESLPEELVVAIAAETVWGQEAVESTISEVSEQSASPRVPQDVGYVVDTPEPRQDASGAGGANCPAMPSLSLSESTDRSASSRRAIVCFVGDRPHLVQQVLALRLSWLYARSPDTDLVVMGPAPVLARLPDDLVKIEQRSVENEPEWHGYYYTDSIISLNGAGAERLDHYSHILRTDVDTFITPAWNDFHPAEFTFGYGGYSNDDDVRRRIRDIAAQYGLTHHGITSIGSTWYGPTETVRRACAFSEMLIKHLLTHHFASDEGRWPGWYRGVSTLYAGEIAVNHCAPDAQHSELLDAPTTSLEPISRYAHIHCWHTDEKFSKHAFMAGRYTAEDAQDLKLENVRDYCMAVSFRSLCDLLPPYGIADALKDEIEQLIKLGLGPVPQCTTGL